MVVKHEERKHAPLPPSASSRWLVCHPSQGYIARLIASKIIKKRVSGEAAKRGTRIHEIAEPWLRALIAGKKHVVPKKAAKDEVAVAKRYVDYCMKRWEDALLLDADAKCGVESKSVVTKECWGSCDFWIFAAKRFTSIDLKSGYVSVDPKGNTQLIIYALGVIREHGFTTREVELCVWQPGSEDFAPDASFIYTMREFTDLVIGLTKDIEKATSFLDKKLDEKVLRQAQVAGSHCDFCDALSVCPTAAEYAASISSKNFKPVTSLAKAKLPDTEALTAAQVSEILTRAPMFISWIDAIRERALSLAQKGEKLIGHKVVHKQTRRAWESKYTDAQLARKLGINIKELMKSVRRSPSEIEELLDKADRRKLDAVLFKPVGDPVVVPSTDRRIEIPSTKISFTPVSRMEEEDG